MKKDVKIGLAIVNDDTMKSFNKRYRDSDCTTDVLSFEVKKDFPDGYYFLGDVIVSLDKVKDQAKVFNTTEKEEIARVFAHGVLHLLGYKDKIKQEKKAMREKEDKIVKCIFTNNLKKGIDYIGVAVGAVILNKKGELFLAKRGKKARNERGTWEFPGGGIEFNEELRVSLRREMKEEFGFEVEPIEFLHVQDHIIKKEKQHWVTSSFLCKVKKGKPRICEPHKCSEIGWFTLDEIEKMSLSVVTREDLKFLKKKYPKGLPNLY